MNAKQPQQKPDDFKEPQQVPPPPPPKKRRDTAKMLQGLREAGLDAWDDDALRGRQSGGEALASDAYEIVQGLQQWAEDRDGLSVVPTARMVYSTSALEIHLGDICVFSSEVDYWTDFSIESCKSHFLCAIEELRPFFDELDSGVLWTKVEDELPEIDRLCFVHCDDGTEFVGARAMSEGCVAWCRSYAPPERRAGDVWESCDIEHDDDYQVTHWMYLPDPPSN